MLYRTRFIRQLYSWLFVAATPLVVLRLLWRSRLQPDYRRRLNERFGFVQRLNKPSIWLHSVSVGESIAAQPLIEKLIQSYPQHTILITTTTPTGSKQITDHFGKRIAHSYLPYDIPCCLQRFIKRTQPKLAILMETEIWPNLLFACDKNQIPVLLANARLSEKSYLGYRRLGKITKDIFSLFTKIAAQNKLDANHFAKLGVDSEKITITGSIKFDREVPTSIISKSQQTRHNWNLQNRPVFIAASTRDGEEPFILDALQSVKKSHPEIFLILVPRHTDRINELVKLCQSKKLSFTKRSDNANNPGDHALLLGDTIGEMLFLYGLADIAYVGGSLVDTGCHNVLEPAALAMPIITGPSIRNFKTICEMLTRAGGQKIINNANELAAHINQLIESPTLAKEIGTKALSVYESNKGALDQHCSLIADYT